MKEFDEEAAAAAMAAAIQPSKCTVDDALEVLDLVYDYLEQNNYLDLSLDDEREPDTAQIVQYVSRQLRKNPVSVPLTDEQLLLMLQAEDDYEESIAAEDNDR